MTQIDALQGRISAALERISYQLERQKGAVTDGPSAEDVAALKQALEDEKLANAQLEERVKALHDKQKDQVAGLEAKVAEQARALARLERESSALRAVGAALRDNNDALRTANAAGVGDAHLINTGLRAELESLKADRAAEQAEVAAILDELSPLLTPEDPAKPEETA